MKKLLMICLLVTMFVGCAKRKELVMECYRDGKLIIKERSTVHSLVGRRVDDEGAGGFDKCIISGVKNEQ